MLVAGCLDEARNPLAPDSPELGPLELYGGPAYALMALEEKLTAADGVASDAVGLSVSISGDLALVGAPFDDDNGSDAGAAYVFERIGGGWSEVARLTASDGDPGDRFGESVSISGQLALVGTNARGSAYVFDGAAGWSEVAVLTASGGWPGDRFGESVAIIGQRAVVIARRDDDNGGASGSAYVFDGAAGWGEVARITAPDGAAGDHFARAVDVSGDVAIAGVSPRSSAYVFELVATPEPTGALADLIAALPEEVFKSTGHHHAMSSILADVEAAVAAGDVGEAIRKLRNLRRRVDGRGAEPDNDDRVVDCAAQSPAVKRTGRAACPFLYLSMARAVGRAVGNPGRVVGVHPIPRAAVRLQRARRLHLGRRGPSAM